MFWLKIKQLWRTEPKRLIVGVIASALMLIGLLVLVSSTIPSQPRVVLGKSQKVGVASAVVVKFSLPVVRRDISVEVTPEMAVETRWSGGIFNHLSRTLVITPESAWEPNHQYQLTFRSVHGVVGFGAVRDATIYFETDGLPEIANVSVSAAKLVRPDETITVLLDQEPAGIAEFFFQLTPEINYSVTQNGAEFQLMFDEPLAPGTTYILAVERQIVSFDQASSAIKSRLEKEPIFQTEFTIISPVLVASVAPQGSAVLPSTNQLTVGFNEAMDRDSVLAHLILTPTPTGSWRWADDLTVVYQMAEPLPIDTKYSLVIGGGAKAQSGSFTTADQTFSFSTVGALRVIKSSPRPATTGMPINQPIEITFDQPVVQDSIISALTISPSINYIASWSGNTLKLSLGSPLSYNSSYQLKIAAGASSQYGLALKNDYLLRFTSEQTRKILAVPLDYQDRPLSCEAAALKMALNYRGVSVSESDIMAVVGYDPTIKSGNIWGDPDRAFVGNIDGSQNSTGYGVHWEPIARAAKTWRNALAFSGWSATELAWEIEAGNPVVIWGVLGSGYLDPWFTPAGRSIVAWKGEHARTVIGYVGSTANPTAFIINDPIVGRLTWSTAKLLANWAKFNNSGVVVY